MFIKKVSDHDMWINKKVWLTTWLIQFNLLTFKYIFFWTNSTTTKHVVLIYICSGTYVSSFVDLIILFVPQKAKSFQLGFVGQIFPT